MNGSDRSNYTLGGGKGIELGAMAKVLNVYLGGMIVPLAITLF